MKSVKARFNQLKNKRRKENEMEAGAYIYLAKAVQGQKFARKTLISAFKDLVPKNEYKQSEARELINHLEWLSNRLEDGDFEASNHLRGVEKSKDEQIPEKQIMHAYNSGLACPLIK